MGQFGWLRLASARDVRGKDTRHSDERRHSACGQCRGRDCMGMSWYVTMACHDATCMGMSWYVTRYVAMPPV
eukprot:74348-Chlamydomonas_euryale.AAC.1